MTYEETLALCRGFVAELQLTCELDTPKYKAFRMAKPGTRMYCVLLTFTPEGITLSGDYRVTNDRAVSSDPGLDLAWFAGELGSDYLASKFLRERWVPEQCVKEIEELADECNSDARAARADGDEEAAKLCAKRAAKLIELAIQVRTEGLLVDKDAIMYGLQKALPGHCDFPGHTYDYMERASLTAIQEKFAALYKAWVATTPAPAPTTDWLQQSETYRKLIEGSMEKYSQQLGWGLGGAQPECWTMLDLAVERLAKLDRELPMLATNLKDLEVHMRTNMGPGHNAALLAVLDSLKQLGIEPYHTVAVQG